LHSSYRLITDGSPYSSNAWLPLLLLLLLLLQEIQLVFWLMHAV
jgi:hypothetical protein